MKFSNIITAAFFFCVTLHANAQKYIKLHNKAIVVDAHNDVLSSITLEGLDFTQNLKGKAHSDLQRWQQGAVDAQIFSIFCDERKGKGEAFKYAIREIDSLDAIVARNSDKMMLVTNKFELKQALQQKKFAALKGVEGGHMIEDRMEYLDTLYIRGARYLTLTWNNSTSWASSAKDETLNSLPPGQQKGLNDFGKKVVRRMETLGMLVDLSHVGEQTFWDVMAIARKPVIVSHSCAKALCNHRRNLTDEQIKAVAKNGGVIHVNFYSGFLDSSYDIKKQALLLKYKTEVDSLKNAGKAYYEIDNWILSKYPEEAFSLRPKLSQLINHIDHIVKLAGINHVGLGSDFDGIESMPQELNGVEDFPLITKALLERGYRKKQIRKILGQNFLRIFN
jgi:membrane dipeptidase